MQKIVGGTIQAIYPFPQTTVAVICNDEGKLTGLPLNRTLKDDHMNPYDVIAGTFFICNAPPDSDDFASLTEEQMEFCLQTFWWIESFLTVNGNVIVTLS